MEKIIWNFRYEYFFLSNFYKHEIKYCGILYPSSEHAYQAMKTRDEKIKKEISQLSTPSEAKKYGNKIDIRPEWEKIKFTIMIDILFHKFKNKYLAEKLLETGDAYLIERNYWHDNYWGDCNCISCKDIEGYNALGRILMFVRIKLQIEKENKL